MSGEDLAMLTGALAAGASDGISGNNNASTAFMNMVQDRQRSSHTDTADDSSSDDNADNSGAVSAAATAGGTYKKPLVQTTPPTTSPPTYHGDGSMRSRYEHAARLHDWAASEYEKQGKEEAARVEREQANVARQQAAQLNSNAPYIKP